MDSETQTTPIVKQEYVDDIVTGSQLHEQQVFFHIEQTFS